MVDMRGLAKGADASTPTFVDVGGAAGHQCIAVRDNYPDLAGRIMREVVHDWPNDNCKEILRGTRAAMTGTSVLLIDEMVFPERGAPWRATALDVTMMSCLAAIERSDYEWRILLDEADFKIVDMRKYTDECTHAVIFTVPKQLCWKVLIAWLVSRA